MFPAIFTVLGGLSALWLFNDQWMARMQKVWVDAYIHLSCDFHRLLLHSLEQLPEQEDEKTRCPTGQDANSHVSVYPLCI